MAPKCAKILPLGSVAERLNAPVLKTGVGKPIVSSNLTGPASLLRGRLKFLFLTLPGVSLIYT